MQPLKTCHSVACQCQPFYSVLHTKSISPFRCFVFCFFCTLNTSCGNLCDLCSALTLPGILPNTISNLWKTSTVIQIPKRPPPTALNHYRAVALTSVVMKCLERILLNIISPFVTTRLHLSTMLKEVQQIRWHTCCTFSFSPWTHLETMPSFSLLISVLHSRPSRNTEPQHYPHLIQLV